MKWLKYIFDFYLDASIHVGLSVLSLCYISCVFFQIEMSGHLAYFIFFGTIACYNFIKYGVEAEKYILVANRYHKNIQFASFIALVVVVYHAYFLPKEVWTTIGVMAVLTGLYALPLLPNTKNLRSFGGLKILLVAMVWAGSTVLLPVIVKQNFLSWDVWVEVIQRVLLVLILLIPFEIRDLKYDALEIKTLPQRIGTTQSKIVGVILILLFYVLNFLKDDISLLEIISKGILFLGLGAALLLTKKNQKGYFSSFWIEAIPIIWLGSILLLGRWI